MFPWYTPNIQTKHSLLLQIFSHCSIFLHSLTPLPHPSTFLHNWIIVFFSCSFDYLSDDLWSKSYIVMLFLAAYALPLGVISYCYFYIMSSVKQHDKEILGHQRVQGEVQVLPYNCIDLMRNFFHLNTRYHYQMNCSNVMQIHYLII